MSLSEEEKQARFALVSAEAKTKREQVKALAILARERTRAARLVKVAGNRAADAVLDGKDTAKGWVRANPGKAAGIGGVLAILVANKPLRKLACKLAHRHREQPSRENTNRTQADTTPPEGE